jgi:capsular exopolysaccharide synthesis family protein
MRAEADRILKQSIYEEVKAGRVAQMPEAFTNPRAIELQRKLSELQITAANLDVNYGPESPQVIEVRQQIAAVQGQMDANTRLLEEKLKRDYERANRDEQSLKSLLSQAQAEAVYNNEANIRYSILKAQFDTAKSLYTGFLQKTNQANFEASQQSNNLRVIQPARVPRDPSGPRRPLIIGLALFLSLGVGIGLALSLDHFDTTIKSVEDVGYHMQLPALGIIPVMPLGARRIFPSRTKIKPIVINNTSVAKNPGEPYDSMAVAADAYCMLRTSVLLSAGDRTAKTILVTSSQPNEGKTTTVVNMAISMAQLGESVLIIDCDLRTPSVHEFFGVEREPGLSTYLSSCPEIYNLIRKLPIPNLSLLAAGTPTINPPELISSEKMRGLLTILAMRYDRILIDSPPLLNLADPVILSTIVDGVMLVMNSGKTTRDLALRARDELLKVGAGIIGVVLNNVDFRHEDLGYLKQYSIYK